MARDPFRPNLLRPGVPGNFRVTDHPRPERRPVTQTDADDRLVRAIEAMRRIADEEQEARQAAVFRGVADAFNGVGAAAAGSADQVRRAMGIIAEADVSSMPNFANMAGGEDFHSYVQGIQSAFREFSVVSDTPPPDRVPVRAPVRAPAPPTPPTPAPQVKKRRPLILDDE